MTQLSCINYKYPTHACTDQRRGKVTSVHKNFDGVPTHAAVGNCILKKLAVAVTGIENGQSLSVPL